MTAAEEHLDDPDSPDERRVRSLLGIVIGRLGPQAHDAVTGTLLTLLVASKTSSAFLVTFGTSAHNLFVWLTIPLVGRFSDARQTRIGRRVPVIAGALMVMGIGTFLYPEVDGYWALVLLVAIVRTAAVNNTVTNAVALPETFGRNRWIRAGGVVALTGLIVSLGFRGTVFENWEADDPSTWGSTFQIGGVLMIIAAIGTIIFLREAPAAASLTTAARHRGRIKLTDAPNRRRIVALLLLLVFGGGATGWLFPVYATDALGATPADLAAYPLWSGPMAIFAALIGGVWLNRRLARTRMVILAPLGLAAVSGLHVFATSLWHVAILGAIAAALAVGLVLSILPLALQLLPADGGWGERVGAVYGPIIAISVIASYIAGLTADVVDDIRVLWLFAAAAGVFQALFSIGLEVPEGRQHTDLPAMIRLAKSAWRRSHRKEHSLTHGELTTKDVDVSDLIDRLRDATDPYRPNDGAPDEGGTWGDVTEALRRPRRGGPAEPATDADASGAAQD